MGWILSVVIFLLVIFGLMPVSKEDNVPINSVLSVVYGSLHRSAWAAAIGWIVFACFHGYGGKDVEQSLKSYNFHILFHFEIKASLTVFFHGNSSRP